MERGPQRGLLRRQLATALPADYHRPAAPLRGDQRRGRAGELELASVVDEAVDRAAQAVSRFRQGFDRVSLSGKPPGSGFCPPLGRRNHPHRRQPVALCAVRGIGSRGIQRPGAGGAVRPDGISTNRRSAVLHYPRPAWLLLVQTRKRDEGGAARAGRNAARGARSLRRVGTNFLARRQIRTGKDSSRLFAELSVVRRQIEENPYGDSWRGDSRPCGFARRPAHRRGGGLRRRRARGVSFAARVYYRRPGGGVPAVFSAGCDRTAQNQARRRSRRWAAHRRALRSRISQGLARRDRAAAQSPRQVSRAVRHSRQTLSRAERLVVDDSGTGDHKKRPEQYVDRLWRAVDPQSISANPRRGQSRPRDRPLFDGKGLF